MTTTPPPVLAVHSPADLLAAIPYIFGFHPADSLVAVSVANHRVLFAARFDLAAAEHSADELLAELADVADKAIHHNVSGVLLAGYGTEAAAGPVIDAAMDVFFTHGVTVVEALRVSDGRYISRLCHDQTCCPPEGVAFDLAATQFAATATYVGLQALPDRDALYDLAAPIVGEQRRRMDEATERAKQVLYTLTSGGANNQIEATYRQAGIDAVNAATNTYRDGGRLDDDQAAHLSLLLCHIPVRDHAGEKIDGSDWQLELWADLTRRSSPDLAAAPASLLALTAWRRGQSVLAGAAVQRALDADPDYSLALLLCIALSAAVPAPAMDEQPPPASADPTEPSRPAQPDSPTGNPSTNNPLWNQ